MVMGHAAHGEEVFIVDRKDLRLLKHHSCRFALLGGPGEVCHRLFFPLRGKSGGYNSYLDLIGHLIGNGVAPDDYSVLIRCLSDDLRRLSDLMNAQVGAAGYVEQNSLGALQGDGH